MVSTILLSFILIIDSYAVEVLLTDTRVSGELYLQLPFSTPIQSHFLHSHGQLQLQMAFSQPKVVHLQELPLYIANWCLFTTTCTFLEEEEVKTESIRKLSNFNFQWTKILYQKFDIYFLRLS